MVDLIALLPLALVILAGLWALWLVFKRDLLAQNLGKLISYFLGAVLTFLAVGLLVVWFLPSWIRMQLEDANSSQDVQAIQNIVQENWNEATAPRGVAPTAAPVATENPVSPIVVTPDAGAANPGIQSVQPGGATKHTVVAGDTLYSLSKRYGVSVAAIQQANNLATENIQVGQVLTIPAP